MIVNHFGLNLKKLRKRRNLSRLRLAERIYSTKDAITAWEIRGTNPNYDRLIQIADFFEVTIDDLLKGEIK